MYLKVSAAFVGPFYLPADLHVIPPGTNTF